MAKTQMEDMRARRDEMQQQIAAALDPSQALAGLEPLFNASNKWFESWVAVSSQLLEFSRSRIDRNLEVSRAMARAGSIDETMDLQANFARSTVRDYFAEANKLADLSTRVVLGSLWSWQPPARGETAHRRSAA